MEKSQRIISFQQDSKLSFLQKVNCGYFETLPIAKIRKRRVYFWNCTENYIYLCYLKKFVTEINDSTLAKKMKFFTRIAKLIPTRSSHQIKSHHQKLLMKYKSLKIAIDQLELMLYHQIKKRPQEYKQIIRISQSFDVLLESQKVHIESLYRYHKGVMSENLLVKSQQILKQQPYQDTLNVKNNEVKTQQESQNIYKYFLPLGLSLSQLNQCKQEGN